MPRSRSGTRNLMLGCFSVRPTRMPFRVWVDCWHLEWQVSSAAQISNALSQVFSAVEHLTLTLGHEVHSQSSEEHNDVDRINGAAFLGRLATRCFASRTDSSKNSLVVYDWRTESFLWSFYLNCSDSHILEIATPVMHSPHLSIPARTQVAL
jgi:hypothetical protein